MATLATARVRWGNSRFWRINEFATEQGARAFAAELREAHSVETSVAITVERRQGAHWVCAD